VYNFDDNDQWCLTERSCQDETTSPFICLKNDASPSPAPTTTTNTTTTTTTQAPPAEINNVVDAWNDMVVFPNASTHGCQCLNLLSDADQRYPGRPRDELDQVCLDWQNAIKCQRFEGGVCGPMKEDELPSYTNYANCTLNTDPCAAALCEINRKFATDVNNLNGDITPLKVIDPIANCTREHDGPKFDSCCFTDIYSSTRYDSVASQCVAGAVEPKPTPTPSGLNAAIIEAEADGWTLIPANLGITEGTHYKNGGEANGEYAKAFCESEGGFLPMSLNRSDMYNYKQLSGSSNGYYWSGFRKTSGTWNADPASGDASFTDSWRTYACAMAYVYGTTANIYGYSCGTLPQSIICLKDLSAS